MARKPSKYVLRSEYDALDKNKRDLEYVLSAMAGHKLVWRSVKLKNGERYMISICRMNSKPLIVVIFKPRDGHGDDISVTDYETWKERMILPSDLEMKIAADKLYCELYLGRKGTPRIELMKKEDEEIEDADQHVDVEPID